MENSRIISSLGVVIATVGRSEIAAATILSLARRKTLPACVVVVGADEKDLPLLPPDLPFAVSRLLAPAKGLPIQRNHGVRQLPATVEFVAFLDDDMEVHDDYCAELENVFRSRPDVAGFSGWIMANGGIDRNAARQLLDDLVVAEGMPAFEFYANRWPGFYGCAMNARRKLLELEKFDERLPLYAIGEDCEMGFRLNRHGAVGGSGRCAVVHLAARSGRISEFGVGYAQIINPLYFSGKGIGYPRLATWWLALVRLPLVNGIFWLFSAWDKKQAVDRKGRFLGNLRALADVLRGQVRPENLLKVLAAAKK